MFKITLDKGLLSLVKDKRVAVVGPSPHLVGTGAGEKIDNYDVVVRMNDIVPKNSLRVDYGSRTDIMVHNLGTPWMTGLKNKIAAFPEEYAKLKMVICTAIKADHQHGDWMHAASPKHMDLIENFKSINVNDTPFYWIGWRDYMILYQYYRTELYTGTTTLSLLLSYPVKELYVTGMTFHQDGDTNKELYIDGHWDAEDLKNRPQTGWNGGVHAGSTSRTQMNMLREIINKNNRVTIDSKLEEFGFISHDPTL